jgi:3-hydroxyacyl-CoA dehydrogenase
VTKPFDEGMKIERSYFIELDGHARIARPAPRLHRRARRLEDPRRARTTPRRARSPSVGVIGAGTMGGGITMNFLNAGIPVTMLEMKQEALDKGIATIRKNYENSMKKGKLKARRNWTSAWACSRARCPTTTSRTPT